VSISSNSNRTEPAATFDLVHSIYGFREIRDQLGQGPDALSLENRGVLRLEKRPSWVANDSELPPPLVEPFVRDFADMKGSTEAAMTSNYTAFMWQGTTPDSQVSSFVVPDPMHVWLLQEILTTGGSVAFALQSMITVLSGMAYYDQIAQFNNNQTIEVAYFVTANTPQRHWGLLAVCILLAIHLVLVIIVVTVFARKSRYSMLGNTWQGLSQAATEETRQYLAVASMMTDSEMEERMNKDGLKRTAVGVDEIDGSGVVGVVRRVGNSSAQT